MNITSVLRLESRTSPENFEKKSMSFYGHDSLDALAFLMGQPEVLMVHVCNKTEKKRTFVVNGMRLYNSLEIRSYRKKKVVVYRYET